MPSYQELLKEIEMNDAYDRSAHIAQTEAYVSERLYSVPPVKVTASAPAGTWTTIIEGEIYEYHVEVGRFTLRRRISSEDDATVGFGADRRTERYWKAETLIDAGDALLLRYPEVIGSTNLEKFRERAEREVAAMVPHVHAVASRHELVVEAGITAAKHEMRSAIWDAR